MSLAFITATLITSIVILFTYDTDHPKSVYAEDIIGYASIFSFIWGMLSFIAHIF